MLVVIKLSKAEISKIIPSKTKNGFLETFLASLAVSLVQPVFFSVVKGINGIGVRMAGSGYMDKNF